MTTLATTRALWYVTRGTGVTALIILTASVVLGIVVSLRWRGRRWPRFALTNTHRNLTLLSILFVVAHVVTTVADRYAPISLTAAFIPFSSPYRPVWLGLGAVAFDLLLALVVTSLFRTRIRPRFWRGVHWLAYAAWPVALVHAFGTGSDARVGWFQLLGLGCLAVVALAALTRIALGGGTASVRLAGATLSLATPLAIVLWAGGGPFQSGWARRAGTPTAILARHVGMTEPASDTTLVSAPGSFVSALSGSIRETQAANGLVTVRLDLRLRGGPRGMARIDLRGVPGGGGVSMTASGVSFAPATTRSVYTGQVVGLDGSRVVAVVHDAAGDALTLRFALTIDRGSRSVSGIVAAGTRRDEG